MLLNSAKTFQIIFKNYHKLPVSSTGDTLERLNKTLRKTPHRIFDRSSCFLFFKLNDSDRQVKVFDQCLHVLYENLIFGAITFSFLGKLVSSD